MIANPYITRLNTQIVKKLLSKDKVHMALKDIIALDHDKYSCLKEDVYINKEKVQQSYQSSLGPVYVINENPSLNTCELSLDYDQRIKNLKSLTCRYLINPALNKYLELEASDFEVSNPHSSLKIKGITDHNQALEVAEILEKAINMYIKSGLEISSYQLEDQVNTIIPGIYSGPYLCPHLNNLGEIGRFQISHYSLDHEGATLYYNN